MSEIQLGVIESRFADMIWEKEPVTSTELVKLAEQEFNWKRTTTHTVIKRLCDKGL
ncbi:MAG: BlaI/MecI/CopY family transcriptional regulator, partial [Acetatifactor sp.]|nr:BlaI/MecI/CopY family transcriptional regulator [Acetatifactor sp.]